MASSIGFFQINKHISQRRWIFGIFGFEDIWNKGIQKSIFYLIVWEFQRIKVEFFIISTDSQVTGLVEERNRIVVFDCIIFQFILCGIYTLAYTGERYI